MIGKCVWHLDKINKWADCVQLSHVNDAWTVLFFICFNYNRFYFPWSSLHRFELGTATVNSSSKQKLSIMFAYLLDFSSSNFSPRSFNHATISPRFLNHVIISPRVFNHISLSTWFFSLISAIFLPFWILKTYYTNNKFSWFFQFYLPHTFWSGWL